MDPIAKLKEELEAKKRKLQEVASTTATTENTEKKKKVYLTKGQTKKLLEQSSSSQAQENSESSNKESESISSQQVDNGSGQTAKKWIPKEEVVRRLRSLKAPITLFGENDEERITRLRKLELSRPDEEEETRGQKNFLLEEKKREKEKLLEGDSSAEDELTPEQKREKKLLRLQKLKSKEDDALKTQNKHDLISTWLRRCLKEWEIDIDELSDDFAKTVKGRQEINTFKQTKIYLKPLFKMLKTRSLPGDILDRLGEIIKWCRRREYTKAADEYLLLSIGKAAWPMGVTMVGIHERSAREKIFSQDVAHILNDETQRKFIQSVKRLMTYSQNKYPPSSFTKAIEPTCIDQHAPSYLRQMGKIEAEGIWKK